MCISSANHLYCSHMIKADAHPSIYMLEQERCIQIYTDNYYDAQTQTLRGLFGKFHPFYANDLSDTRISEFVLLFSIYVKNLTSCTFYAVLVWPMIRRMLSLSQGCVNPTVKLHTFRISSFKEIQVRMRHQQSYTVYADYYITIQKKAVNPT